LFNRDIRISWISENFVSYAHAIDSQIYRVVRTSLVDPLFDAPLKACRIMVDSGIRLVFSKYGDFASRCASYFLALVRRTSLSDDRIHSLVFIVLLWERLQMDRKRRGNAKAMLNLNLGDPD
jgi:hypothetical protein